jgi:1,4-alpha-glucan branching enzyme
MTDLTPFDLHLFREGTHAHLYEKFGAAVDGRFRVWVPDAAAVSVIGDFNDWKPEANALEQRLSPDIWEGRAAAAHAGSMYKYRIRRGATEHDEPDPFAFCREEPPGDASVICELPRSRSTARVPPADEPVAICTWSMRTAKDMGYTHVLLPPVSRFVPVGGTPEHVSAAVAQCLREGLGSAVEIGGVDLSAESSEARSIALSAVTFWQEVYGVDVVFRSSQEWLERMMRYVAVDPLFRKYQHGSITWVPPAGEVLALLAPPPYVHGHRHATLRAVLAWMYALPGRKVLGPLEEPGLPLLIGQLNHLYRTRRALQPVSDLEWIEEHEAEMNIIAFVRRDFATADLLLFVANFSPVPRLNYRIGVPARGFWREVLNTDAAEYGGSAHGNLGGVEAVPIPLHGQRHSITITVPPMAGVFFAVEQQM